MCRHGIRLAAKQRATDPRTPTTIPTIIPAVAPFERPEVVAGASLVFDVGNEFGGVGSGDREVGVEVEDKVPEKLDDEILVAEDNVCVDGSEFPEVAVPVNSNVEGVIPATHMMLFPFCSGNVAKLTKPGPAVKTTAVVNSELFLSHWHNFDKFEATTRGCSSSSQDAQSSSS